MDIEALKTVVLVSQLGSLAAAARVLEVDPSSVSRTVAGVEDQLGLRIFQRTTRALSTTEEGERYLHRIAPLLEEFDRARDEAGHGSTSPSGTLRLTASVAFAQVCILPHLGAFHELYPDVTIELLPTDSNLDLLANGIDLAVRLAAAPEGELISTRLISTHYHVCAAPRYLERHGPISSPADLERCNCLRFALPDFRTRWLFRKRGGKRSVETFAVPVSGRMLISGALLLRDAARDGLGPALLPDWLVAEDLACGTLVDLFPDYDCAATEFDTGAWLLYPSRSFLPRKVRVMIDFLRARVLPTGARGGA